MKKFFKVFIVVIIVIAGLAIGGFYMFNKTANQSSKEDQELLHSLNGENKAESDLVETSSGIVYTGKIVPVESRYYIKDPSKEFKGIYVKQGDIVSKDQLLFDYVPDYSTDAQIDVLDKNFTNLKQQLDDYYSRISEYESWLAGCSPDDKGYRSYLIDEINKTKGLISQNKVDWINAEEKIRKLKDAKSKTSIESEIDGFVFKVNEDNTSTPTNVANAYITIYSNDKKVRINVSEFEIKMFSLGQKIDVKIESNKSDVSGEVIHIDALPNNLESNDTSYYYVDISVPNDVPYGYSAVVTVNK